MVCGADIPVRIQREAGKIADQSRAILHEPMSMNKISLE
jgi:hypothetical protein